MSLLRQYGYFETEPLPDGLLPARVTAVHRERYELVREEGTDFGKLKTSAYYGAQDQPFPVVGDFVLFADVEGGDCRITKTLPRRSYFARLDPDPAGGKQQVIAANFDHVFIMSSLNKDFNISRIERYLALAWQSGASPIVVLTKADLVGDTKPAAELVEAAAFGVDVIPLSIISGVGMERLNAYLTPGSTAVFLGMSGVGKSSLLNTLMEREVMEVRAIREDDGRGRHTTTRRQLFMLRSGAMVIDTPGMRSLGMWEADDGLSDTFSDVEKLLGACRFSDCRHETEPGCAVLAALESGELPAGRWENYNSLKRETLYAMDRSAALREKFERNKSIARWSRQRKKEIW